MGKLIDMNDNPLTPDKVPESERTPEQPAEEQGNELVYNFMRAVQVAVSEPKEPVTFIAETFAETGEGGSFAVTVSFFPKLDAKQTAEHIGATKPEEMH